MTKKETKKIPYGLIGRVALGVIAAAGLISVAAVAPGLLGVVRTTQWYDRTRHRRYETPAYARAIIRKLVKQGKVVTYSRDGEIMVKITDRGKRELLKYQLQERSLKRFRWDGKWRLLVFDIEERRRFSRDRTREDLQSFGFVRLQDSVWVYPYECEEVVALLKAEYKIGKELLYIVAGDIENDMWLKQKFCLK